MDIIPLKIIICFMIVTSVVPIVCQNNNNMTKTNKQNQQTNRHNTTALGTKVRNTDKL